MGFFFILYSIDTVCYINRFLDIGQLCIPRTNLNWLWHIILSIGCSIQFASILLRNFEAVLIGTVSFSSLNIIIIAVLKSWSAKSNVFVLSMAVSMSLGPLAYLYVSLLRLHFHFLQLWRLIQTGSGACCHGCCSLVHLFSDLARLVQ